MLEIDNPATTLPKNLYSGYIKTTPMKSRRMYTLKIVRDEFEREPRISYVQIHKQVKKIVGVKMRDTTAKYIQYGLENKIIGLPRPVLKFHTNFHLHVNFIDGNLFEFDSIVAQKPGIRYACALAGSDECILLTSFSDIGENILFQGFTRADGYELPEYKILRNLFFSKNEKPILINIPEEQLKWDNIDWKLFQMLSRNLRLKYTELGDLVGLGWRPIKKRIEESIIPDCHIATYFFPKGQDNYQQLFLRFTTDFQVNLLKKLNCLQTTTYFLLFSKKDIGIFLFPENINDVLRTFKKIEKEGFISDLRYFLPIGWYHVIESSWPGASTWSTFT